MWVAFEAFKGCPRPRVAWEVCRGCNKVIKLIDRESLFQVGVVYSVGTTWCAWMGVPLSAYILGWRGKVGDNKV